MEPFTIQAFTERYGAGLALREPCGTFQQQALDAVLHAPAGSDRYATHQIGTLTRNLLIAGAAWRFGVAANVLIVCPLLLQEQWKGLCAQAGMRNMYAEQRGRAAHLAANVEADVIFVEGRQPRGGRSEIPTLRQRFPNALIIAVVDVPAWLEPPPHERLGLLNRVEPGEEVRQ